MTTERQEKMNKIKAHLIEFPDDKPADIAKAFDAPVNLVYDAKETLRRHKMLPRVFKMNLRKKTKGRIKAVPVEKAKETDVNVLFGYELASLRAENARLKAIIEYLESAAGIRKAA